MQFYRTLA